MHTYAKPHMTIMDYARLVAQLEDQLREAQEAGEGWRVGRIQEALEWNRAIVFRQRYMNP